MRRNAWIAPAGSDRIQAAAVSAGPHGAPYLAPTGPVLILRNEEISGCAWRPRGSIIPQGSPLFLICSIDVLCSDHEQSILSCPQAPAGHGALRAGGCVFSLSRGRRRDRTRAAARPRRAVQ